ncbi:MAG TPA: hypothetical protein VF894_13255 [Anaeromyxobacter sp.]
MRRMLVHAAVATALLTTIGPARAADVSLGGARDRWPTEITRRPLTLGAGMIEIWGPVQLNASKDADWKPVTLNPSLAFGLTDQWQIGVRHLTGLCLGGANNGCANVYSDVGAFTRISVVRGGGLDVAVQGGVDVVRLQEPRNYAGWAGLVFRGGGGAVALTVAPAVNFGLKDRDTIASRSAPISWNLGTYDVVTNQATVGNKEHLSVPATLQLQLGPALAVAVGASLEGPLNPVTGSFSDFYRVPLGAAVVVTPFRYLDLGAAFTFPAFAGKNDTRDLRFLSAFVAFRI